MKRLVDIVNGLNMKDKSFKRQTIYRVIEENWIDIFGQLAHALSFYYVKNKILYISAKNPSWVNEISYYEASFIQKINQYLPDKKNRIQSLKIVIKASSTSTKYKKKTIVKEVSGRNLEENIQYRNKQRQKLGYKPCLKCGIVLTLQKICPFCKAT